MTTLQVLLICTAIIGAQALSAIGNLIVFIGLIVALCVV